MRRVPIVKKTLNSAPAMPQHVTGDLFATVSEGWQLGTEAFQKVSSCLQMSESEMASNRRCLINVVLLVM